MKLTTQQFCARLRKAKIIAVREYPSQFCIYDACTAAEISLGYVAIFDEGGPYDCATSGWVSHQAKSKNDIAALFDNSIRDLGEEP